MTVSIMGIDPGPTTGVVVMAVDYKKSELESVGAEDVTSYVRMVEIIKHHRPDLVVCEEFVLYEGKRAMQSYSNFPVPRWEGVIEYACILCDIPIRFAVAAERQQFKPPRMLRWLDLWHPSRHVKDAIAHVLAHVCKEDKAFRDTLLRRADAARAEDQRKGKS